MFVVRDLAYLARVGAPSLAVLARLEREGRLSTRDPAPLIAAFSAPGVETDPVRVTAAVAEALLLQHHDDGSDCGDGDHHVLRSLSPGARERLVRSGYIVDVIAGLEVLAPHVQNREAFVVLAGVFELRGAAGKHLATFAPGDMFGAIAFGVSGEHARMLSVHSRSAGKLLILRPSDMDKLADTHPKDVIEVFKALLVTLALRAGVIGVPGKVVAVATAASAYDGPGADDAPGPYEAPPPQ